MRPSALQRASITSGAEVVTILALPTLTLQARGGPRSVWSLMLETRLARLVPAGSRTELVQHDWRLLMTPVFQRMSDTSHKKLQKNSLAIRVSNRTIGVEVSPHRIDLIRALLRS